MRPSIVAVAPTENLTALIRFPHSVPTRHRRIRFFRILEGRGGASSKFKRWQEAEAAMARTFAATFLRWATGYWLN